MTKKAGLILLLIFAILPIAAYFLLFHGEASAPETILIKNSSEEMGAQTESPKNDVPADETPEPEAAKIIDQKKEDPKEATAKPKTGDELSIAKKLVSWGFAPSANRKIDTIILHSSYNALGGDKYDVDKLIAEYREYGVAPHYLIDRKGKIYQLVSDKNIAYHAGESKVPDGRSGVNNFSLGIEMINTEGDNYAAAQYASLNSLLAALKVKYKIKYVLGHDDIAPGRKTDPWNFDWEKIE